MAAQRNSTSKDAERQARRWLVSVISMVALASVATLAPWRLLNVRAASSNYVIHISVDGLKSSLYQQYLAQGALPNFARLQNEGAWTYNARGDYDHTVTLPTHISQLTGRPVENKLGQSDTGHVWTGNDTPALGETLHTNRGFYVNSAFDVAHDNGLSTALYATKDKFILFENSYNSANGAQDITGANNGRDKIDTYVNYDYDTSSMMSALYSELSSSPKRYTFVHFHDADTAGHAYGWGSTEYHNAVVNVDSRLSSIFNAVASNSALNNNTTIILTADHGGIDFGHGDAGLLDNFQVPFILWGPGIPANTDLYSLNGSDTTNPGSNRPDFGTSNQPIHNADAADCALRRLGLPSVPGGIIDNLATACGAGSSPTPTATPVSGVCFTTGILDNFNRTNGSLGGLWIDETGGFSITGNQNDVGAGKNILWNIVYGPDQEACVKLTAIDASTNAANEVGVQLKAQGTSLPNGGLVSVIYRQSTQSIEVWTTTDNVDWQQHGASFNLAMQSGDTLGAKANANGTIEVFRNGVLLGTRSVTAWPYYANGGRIGLWAATSSASAFDSFAGGTTGGSSSPTNTPGPGTATASPTQAPSNTPIPGTSTPTPTSTSGSTVTLLTTGSTWKYLDNGSDQGTAWQSPTFNDGSWASGAAALGYGDPMATTINGGPTNNRYITTYFRRAFTVADASLYSGLTLRLRRDDGAVIYLNGAEVARSNMPTGAINYQTLASTGVGDTDETAFFNFSVPASALVTGNNTVAVEIHQVAIDSSDIGFDLELNATLAPGTPTPTATLAPTTGPSPTPTRTPTVAPTATSAVTTLSAASDAHVRAGSNAGFNYGSAQTVDVKTESNASNVRWGYLRFDTSSISGNVTNVKLRLNAKNNTAGALSVQLFSLSSTTWTEGTLTWNTKPAPNATALATFTSGSTAYTWIEIDVTAYVQAERAAGRNAIAFVLKVPANSIRTMSVRSKESGVSPQLVVTK